MKPTYRDILLSAPKRVLTYPVISRRPELQHHSTKKQKRPLDFGRFNIHILVHLLGYCLPEDSAHLITTSRSMAQWNRTQIWHLTIANQSPFFTRRDIPELVKQEREHNQANVGDWQNKRSGYRPRRRRGGGYVTERKTPYQQTLTTRLSQGDRLALAISAKLSDNKRAYAAGERFITPLRLALASLRYHETRRDSHLEKAIDGRNNDRMKYDAKIIERLRLASSQLQIEIPMEDIGAEWERQRVIRARLEQLYNTFPTRQRKLLRIYRWLWEAATLGNAGAYKELISLIETHLPAKKLEVALFNRRLLWLGDVVVSPTERNCWDEKGLEQIRQYEYHLPSVFTPA